MWDAAVLFERKGTLILLNEQAERLLRPIAHDWLNHVWASAGLPMPVNSNPVLTVFETGQRQDSVAIGFTLPDRDPVWRFVDAIPLMRNKDGSVRAVLGLFHAQSNANDGADVHEGSHESAQAHSLRYLHHRVSNHLQGIANLLQTYQSVTSGYAAEGFGNATLQVLAIASIHKIQAEASDSTLPFTTLLMSIIRSFHQLYLYRFKYTISEVFCDAIVRETDCVLVALIITEILSNAVKHATWLAAESTTLDVSCNHSRVLLTVRNPGVLPTALNVTGTCEMGRGLKLLTGLLPPEGASFSLHKEGSQVVSVLELCEPVIHWR